MLKTCLLICALTAAASAQPEAKLAQRPKAIVALVDRARALPAEFSADILLKLAGSKLIADLDWKRELIEEAFHDGTHAQRPYRQVAYMVSGDARVNQESASNSLEALTLKTRAVEEMLRVDPPRALRLFQDIVFPDLASPLCSEALVPRVETYYQAAAHVFVTAFTPAQREKGQDIALLETSIAGVRSPSQVYPVWKMISDLKLDPEGELRLVSRFAGALQRLEPNDRIYGDIEYALAPEKLSSQSQAGLLLPALRGFIVRSVSGPRCTDSIKAGTLPPSVTRFNQLAVRLDPEGARVKPITADEAKPLRDDGPRKVAKSWASPRAHQMDVALRWLIHGNRDGNGGLPPRWTLEERKTPEWNARSLEALKLLDGWKEDDEASPEDYLIVVAHSYGALAELIPDGAGRDSMMGRYLNFLETRYASTENRNLWFAQVRDMFTEAHNFADDRERAWLLDSFERSANPVISLYATVEKLIGPGERLPHSGGVM